VVGVSQRTDDRGRVASLSSAAGGNRCVNVRVDAQEYVYTLASC
jgi:hypothetical protein